MPFGFAQKSPARLHSSKSSIIAFISRSITVMWSTFFLVRPAGCTCLTVIIMKIDKSLLLTRPGEELAERQLRHREVYGGRNLMAKHWPDEQEPYTRQSRWMRGPRTLKSKTCTESVVVYGAGISVKAGAHYPGRSPLLFREELDLQRCRAMEDGEVSRDHRSPTGSRTKDLTEERQQGLRP